MRFVMVIATLALTASCAGKDPCADMQEAAADSAGLSCGSGGDCPGIPCACADGSVVTTSSCFNGQCAGIEACDDVCGGEVLECEAGGETGGGGGCCVYSCNGGSFEITGSSSSPTDEDSCRTRAEEFCDTYSVACSTLKTEACLSDECGCEEARDNGGMCPMP